MSLQISKLMSVASRLNQNSNSEYQHLDRIISLISSFNVWTCKFLILSSTLFTVWLAWYKYACEIILYVYCYCIENFIMYLLSETVIFGKRLSLFCNIFLFHQPDSTCTFYVMTTKFVIPLSYLLRHSLMCQYQNHSFHCPNYHTRFLFFYIIIT